LKEVADARENRKSFVAEFRVIRTDGIVRWISARGQFYYGRYGDAERMLGMAVDITDRKQVEEDLASLSGRLISAQEEERKRIAREIHDDYSQHLALLAMGLESLDEEIEDPSANERLHQIWNGIGEVGADLHSLSHRLHSSTLDTLGLVAGAKAFCTEFAEQQGIRVDFADENVPRDVPADRALCLFRIVQEGLRNIKRHSGADRAEVRLECSGEKLHLSVADRGRGFDVNNRSPRSGIGIHSMEERLRLLGGQLSITSHAKGGTKIDAWLPLRTPGKRAV
jgi:signal transduction histidine kinase